jgi:hypothetical protein
MALTTARDLHWLKSRLGDRPGTRGLLLPLTRIAELTRRDCSDEVAWLVLYGSLVERLETGAAKRLTQAGLHVLAVTTLSSFFDATMLLSEKVFGPVLTEFAFFPDLEVWTMDDFKRASQDGGAKWHQVANGISLYGAPPAG